MIFAGDKDRFGIEAEPESVNGDSVQGRFCLWIGGTRVGDWDDCVALDYCYQHLVRFAERAGTSMATEPHVARRAARDIFRLIVDPALDGGIADPREQPVPYAYSRFHITHIGMSALDDYVVVLIKEAEGSERRLWAKHGEDAIGDCWLGPDEAEHVAGAFCAQFRSSYAVAPPGARIVMKKRDQKSS